MTDAIPLNPGDAGMLPDQGIIAPVAGARARSGWHRLPGLSSAMLLFLFDLAAMIVLAPPAILFGQWARLGIRMPDFLLFPPCALLLFFALGLYRRETMTGLRRALARLPLVALLGSLLGMLLSLVLTLATAWPVADLQSLAGETGLAYMLALLSATAARLAFRLLLRAGALTRTLLVIGAGSRAWDLLFMLGREGTRLSDRIVLLHDPTHGLVDPRLLEDPRFIILTGITPLAAARDYNADQVVVAPDERRGMDLQGLLTCKKAGWPVEQYLTFVEREIRRVDLKRMDLSWLLFTHGFQYNLADRVLKRIFDVLVSGFVLILVSPALLIAALAIRLEGRGPILYRQTRVTRDGAHFQILKFRSMKIDAEAGGAIWARKNDDRITATGRFIRRTRIDELPQLINILRGEMSFVGPRPERPEFVAQLAGCGNSLHKSSAI